MKRSNFRHVRRGFTLVELLVVIGIISLLAALITPAVIRALTAAREAAVTFETQQISLAIEEFENDFGFYPPSFASPTNPRGIANVNQFRNFVNRIAPNNRESDVVPNSNGMTRLEVWWNRTGQFLDEESCLVFWLTGISQNKQYPITADPTVFDTADLIASIPAHGLDGAFDEDNGITRISRFDFRASQVAGLDSDDLASTGISFTDLVPDDRAGIIAEYRQAHGSQDGDLKYKYRDSRSYAILDQDGNVDLSDGRNAYHNGGSGNSFEFINPRTFQLISFGLDGLPGDPGNIFEVGLAGNDNICNFADGRLSKFVIENPSP